MSSTQTSSGARAGHYGRSVLISIAAVGAMSLMALANNVVIARVAGPEGRGLYGLAVAVGALLMPIASLGIGSATTWQLGRERAAAELLGLAKRAVLASLGLAVLIAAAVRLGFGLGVVETSLWATLAAGVALPAQLVVEYGRGFALGRRRPLAYNLCSAAVIAALLGLNLGLLAMSHGADAAPPSTWLLVNLVGANWLVAVPLVIYAMRQPSRRPSPALTHSSLRYGLRSSVVALGDAALLRVDYLLAAPIIGLGALGIYAIADQISHLMAWAGLMAGKMMLPEAAGDDASGRRSLAKLGLALRLLIAVTVGASIIAALVGPWLISALFGDAFAPAYYGLLLLLPATFAKGLHALVSTWLQGRGDQRPVVGASAIAVGVELVAVLGLALCWGWLGVALAKTLAYLTQLAASLVALRRHRARAGLDARGWLPEGRWLLDRSDLRSVHGWALTRLTAFRSR